MIKSSLREETQGGNPRRKPREETQGGREGGDKGRKGGGSRVLDIYKRAGRGKFALNRPLLVTTGPTWL